MYAVALLAMIEKVARDLGDDSFEVREAASALLASQGDLAEPRLREARGSRDPEVAHRASAVIKRIYASRADRLLEQYPLLPQIDVMLGHEPAPCDLPLEEARRTTRQDGWPWWSDYREATRVYLRRRVVEEEESTKSIDPMVRKGLVEEMRIHWRQVTGRQ